MSTRPKTNRQRGAPSKKNEAIIKRLIAACKLGLPYGIAAIRAGISRETLAQWRSQDADLDRQLNEARAEAAEKAWKKIMAAGDSGLPNAWQSIAWRLERAHPSEFSRPEIQLHQFNQQNVTNNVLSITVEQAGEFERRSKPICDEIDALLEARKAKLEAHQAVDVQPPAEGKVIDGEAQVILNEPIVLPLEAERTAAWWRGLSRGSGSRAISQEAAKHVIEKVVTLVLGAPRASGLQIDFDDQPTTLRDVHEVLAELCGGSRGWETLVKLGGQ